MAWMFTNIYIFPNSRIYNNSGISRLILLCSYPQTLTTKRRLLHPHHRLKTNANVSIIASFHACATLSLSMNLESVVHLLLALSLDLGMHSHCARINGITRVWSVKILLNSLIGCCTLYAETLGLLQWGMTTCTNSHIFRVSKSYRLVPTLIVLPCPCDPSGVRRVLLADYCIGTIIMK